MLPQLNLYDSLRDQMVKPIIKNINPPSGSLVPSAFGTTAENGTERKAAADETQANTQRLLAEQRNDIDRILVVMSELKREMTSMKKTLAEVKRSEPAENQINRRRSAFPEELEILTENVARLNGRVGDIDGLRLEMIVMKRRVKVLEQGLPSSQSSHTVTGYTPSTYPRPTHSEPRLSSLTSRPAPQPLAPNGIPQRTEADTDSQSPVVASSIESRMQSTDLYGVSPNYRNGDVNINGDHEMRDSSLSSDDPSDSSSQTSSPPESSPQRSQRGTPQPPEAPTQNPPTSASRHINDHTTVQVSDPEDSDYDPDSQRPPIRHQPKRGEKVRLATPEWERPSWSGPKASPKIASAIKSSPKTTASRALGAPEPDPKRRKTDSFAEGLGAFSEGLPASWTESSYRTGTLTQTPTQQSQQVPPSAITSTVDQSLVSRPTPSTEENSAASYVPSPSQASPAPPLQLRSAPVVNKPHTDLRSVPRARDEFGRLLRPDGKIDGRSVRYGTAPHRIAQRRASAGDALKAQPLKSAQPQAQQPQQHAGWAALNSPTTTTTTPPISNNTPPVPPLLHQQSSAAGSPDEPVVVGGGDAKRGSEDATANAHNTSRDASVELQKAAPALQDAEGMMRRGEWRGRGKIRYEKERDEEGNLLARNGRVDGRSLRYKRTKDNALGAEAQLEGAE